MSEFAINLLSTYYGFGKQAEVNKTLSVHDSVNLLSDNSNILIVDESLENEEQTLTKEGSKEEDTIEQYEEGFSTLDEKSTIFDEEIFDDEDFLSELDIAESVIDEIHSDKLEINDKDQKTNFEKLKNENMKIENSSLERSFKKVNEDKKFEDNLNSYKKLSSEKSPSCDGIFYELNGAGIYYFPENIFQQFPNLKMLYLEGNNLNHLPDELFTSLKYLQWLDLRNNQINSLPTTIKGHQNLETILMQGNKLEKLPLELGTLPKLKRIQSSKNPLKFPSNEILALGSAEVLRYLREEWNKIHPEESVQISNDLHILPKASTILCYQPPRNKKVSKMKKNDILMEKTSVRKNTWNYKPSNRCNSSGLDETLESRLLWIEKAKEFLEKRASEVQKLIDRSTLRNWRMDHSSYKKSMIKAANRTEEDIPFAVDSKTLSFSIRQNQKKVKKSPEKRNNLLEKPITDINKNIDQILESLNKLKSTERSETMSPKSEKKMLETEMQKIVDLQNSIKRLKKHNDVIEDPFFDKEINKKSYDFPPSIIV